MTVRMLYLSVRGGAAFGRADIKNEIGGLTGVYMVNINNGEIVTKAWYDFQEPSEQANYIPAGYASLGDLPATDDYSEFAFAAGVSLGMKVFKVLARFHWIVMDLR